MILGIIASSISGSKVVNNSYESIATSTVSGASASSIEFTSIPSTYTHLQLRGILRGYDGATVERSVVLQLNNDTGSNYARHSLYGDGATASAAASSSTTVHLVGYSTDSSATANNYGGFIMDALDYANTSKYKTIRYFTGYDNNGAGNVGLFSGVWMNTNAISSIKIYFGSGVLMKQYSSIALYGIKA